MRGAAQSAEHADVMRASLEETMKITKPKDFVKKNKKKGGETENIKSLHVLKQSPEILSQKEEEVLPKAKTIESDAGEIVASVKCQVILCDEEGRSVKDLELLELTNSDNENFPEAFAFLHLDDNIAITKAHSEHLKEYFDSLLSDHSQEQTPADSARDKLLKEETIPQKSEEDALPTVSAAQSIDLIV